MSDEQAIPSLEVPDEIADGLPHSLDHRRVSHGRLVGAIAALGLASGIMVGTLIVLFAVDGMPRPLRVLVPLVAMAIVVVMCAFVWRWPLLEYRYTSYRVDHDGIEIRRGVLWRSVVDVPRSRIQHTDVSQGPLERNFELATLHVYTAGTAHSEVRLGGLEHTRALRIRDHLLTGGEHDGV